MQGLFSSATFSWTSPLSNRKAEIIVLKCEQTPYLITIYACRAGVRAIRHSVDTSSPFGPGELRAKNHATAARERRREAKPQRIDTVKPRYKKAHGTSKICSL